MQGSGYLSRKNKQSFKKQFVTALFFCNPKQYCLITYTDMTFRLITA